MRIGVIGCRGRIGALLGPEIERQGEVHAGGMPRPDPARPDGALEALCRASDVVIDFSSADAVPAHAAALSGESTAWVLGTTGIDRAGEAAIEAAATRIAVVRAANFAPGVALLRRLAVLLGKALDPAGYDAEIVETHHRGKRDAPSGTALAIGAAFAQGRGVSLDAVAVRDRAARPGPREAGEIGFASLRGGDVIGEHALVLTSSSEQITLAHRAFDRRVFAEGAVRAARWTAGRAPGLYGMDDVLG